jgi:transposase InsO family protein
MMLIGKPESKFEIIRQATALDNNILSISTMCEIAGVSRSGYYRWLEHAEDRSARERKDQSDFDLILEAYQFRGYAKGARSIYMRLLHRNPVVVMNVKKVRRLMKKYGLLCPVRKANPYRRMAKAMRTSHVAPNLLNRQFRVFGPRKVLLTDITYLFYGKGEKCYLSVIMDAYTKQVLAYMPSQSLEVEFVLETVNLLVKNHSVSLDESTIINSDQGCHYTSCKFIEIVNNAGLRQSMSRRANCWDNAPQESFFGHMKDEVDIASCCTFDEVCSAIDDWMDYYNNDRYQWELARLSPNEYAEYVRTGIYPLSAIPPVTMNPQSLDYE